MGQWTMQVVGDVSVGTKTKTYTVSNGDINRLVAFGAAIAISNGIPAPTVAQSLLAYSDAMFALTKERVLANEQAIAAAAISPIVGV